MATPAAVLSILVEANTKAANANLAKTDAQLRGTAAAATATTGATSRAGTAMRKLGTIAKWGGAALAAGFVIEAKKAVTTTQDLTKSTISLHKNLGLSNKQASEWAGVAKARGVDTTKLGMAFKTLSTQIVAARDGSATSILMFKRLGLSQQDIQRASVDTSFAVKAVADGLNNLKGGADKTAIAGKLFGRGWQTIAPVLRDGSKAMQQQLDLVQKYGGVLEGKTLGQQEALLANIRENKIAWQGFQVELAKFVTPALNKVSNQFQRIAAINADPKLTDTQKWQKIAKILDQDFRKALNVIVEAIPIIASRVGQAAPQIAGALVKGFLNANVWGKLLIGSWLISKFGGWAAISAIGGKIGARIGGGIAAGTAAEAEAGAAAGAGSATPWGAIILGSAAATVGVHKLMEAFGNYLQTKDQVARANEILGGQYGDLGKVAQRLAKQIRTTGDISERVWKKGTGTLHEAATAEVQLINGLRDHYGSFAVAGRHLSKEQRNAWIDMALSARENGDITQNQLMKLTNAFTDVGQKNRRMWRQAAQVTGQSVKSIKQSVGDMTVRVSKDYAGMVEVTGGGIRLLAKNTNQALGSLGVAKAKFMASPVAHPAQGGTRNFQRGGHIPGMGEGDKVPAMLEPGEFVVNKKAARVHRDTLEKMNFKDAPRFQGGGVVDRTGVQHLARGGMAAMIAEANKFEARHFPYAWGGGHSGFGIQPVDCSGAVSDVLHAAGLLKSPLTSGGLMSWGKPGRGPLTVFANPDHTVMSLNGRVFGTSASNPGRGAGWIDGASGESLAPGAVRTMDVIGGVAKELKRIMLKGPKGTLKDMGQGALDKTWKAANAYIAKQTPGGAFGGGQPLMENFKGGKTVAASWYGPTPSTVGGSGVSLPGTMSFAELGWHGGDETQATGLGGLPYGAKVLIGYKGKAIKATKLDVGAGGPGIDGYPRAVDLWRDLAKALKFDFAKGVDLVEVKKAQKGGVVGPYVGSFAKGGEVAETGLAHVHKGETVLPGFQRGGNVQHRSHLAELQMDARHLERLIHRIQQRPEPINPQVQKARDKEIKAAQARIDTDKELITELKALRAETREHNRLVKTVRVNQRSALEAVVNLTASQIGAQGLQKTRNASPGRAARY